jgi:CheY-like chemotaxis protein
MMLFYVDDDPDDVELFLDALKSTKEPVNCMTARDGEEALLVLESSQVLPELIFLDINMPRMNGLQFLVEMKKNKRLAHIPVIVYSTSRYFKEINEFYRMGVSKVMIKQSSYEHLCFELNEIIRGIRSS